MGDGPTGLCAIYLAGAALHAGQGLVVRTAANPTHCSVAMASVVRPSSPALEEFYSTFQNRDVGGTHIPSMLNLLGSGPLSIVPSSSLLSAMLTCGGSLVFPAWILSSSIWRCQGLKLGLSACRAYALPLN